MYIPFTIKMKVILVFLFRFYTTHKNVRTHIKCTEENSKKPSEGIHLVLAIQGLSCLPRQTASTTQTKTHMSFSQQSQIYAITIFSSKSISSFNFKCLNINGFRNISFKIPNKHYCICDYNILFKYFSISRFLNSFSRFCLIFVGLFLVCVGSFLVQVMYLLSLLSHAKLSLFNLLSFALFHNISLCLHHYQVIFEVLHWIIQLMCECRYTCVFLQKNKCLQNYKRIFFYK